MPNGRANGERLERLLKKGSVSILDSIPCDDRVNFALDSAITFRFLVIGKTTKLQIATVYKNGSRANIEKRTHVRRADRSHVATSVEFTK
jgi:hypothetical protein